MEKINPLESMAKLSPNTENTQNMINCSVCAKEIKENESLYQVDKDDLCSDCIKIYSKNEENKRLLKLGLSKHHLTMGFDNYKIDHKNKNATIAFGEYVENGGTKGLYLHGKCGNGKTHLAVSLFKEISQSDNKCRFITTPELLLEIREAFNNKSDVSEKELIDRYSGYNYLFLDDFGAEKASEWSIQTIYLILDRAIRNEKHLIITSNHNLSEISKTLGDRIASRITELCKIVKIDSDDMRGK